MRMKVAGIGGSELRAVGMVTGHTVGSLEVSSIFTAAVQNLTCRQTDSIASEMGFAPMTVVATPGVALLMVAEK